MEAIDGSQFSSGWVCGGLFLLGVLCLCVLGGAAWLGRGGPGPPQG